MKASPHFKTAIQNHLNGLAANDELFAETLKKPNKNIDDCITYIFNQVKASGCNGFADDEIYQMATHYYDEDDIKIGKPISGKVVVNHQVEIPKIELTTEDIEKAKQKAINQAIEEEKAKLQKKKQPKKEVINVVEQASLFD